MSNQGYTNMPAGGAGGAPAAPGAGAPPGGYHATTMGVPAPPDSHPGNAYAAAQQGSSTMPSSVPPPQGAGKMDQLKHGMGQFGVQAGAFSKNLWGHLSAGGGVTHTAVGKLQNLKLLTPGMAEKFWRETFSPPVGDFFSDYFACHLSTSTGAVAGNIFLSTGSVAFLSDRPLTSTSSPGQTSSNFYKVYVPMDRISVIEPTQNQNRPEEKYLEMTTVDEHKFWFMGFLSYDKAVQELQLKLKQHKTNASNTPGQQGYFQGQNQPVSGSSVPAQTGSNPAQPGAQQGMPGQQQGNVQSQGQNQGQGQPQGTFQPQGQNPYGGPGAPNQGQSTGEPGQTGQQQNPYTSQIP